MPIYNIHRGINEERELVSAVEDIESCVECVKEYVKDKGFDNSVQRIAELETGELMIDYSSYDDFLYISRINGEKMKLGDYKHE